MPASIVRETDRFGSQSLVAQEKDSTSWKAVAAAELKAFLGLVIAMSIHSLLRGWS